MLLDSIFKYFLLNYCLCNSFMDGPSGWNNDVTGASWEYRCFPFILCSGLWRFRWNPFLMKFWFFWIFFISVIFLCHFYVCAFPLLSWFFWSFFSKQLIFWLRGSISFLFSALLISAFTSIALFFLPLTPLGKLEGGIYFSISIILFMWIQIFMYEFSFKTVLMF